MSRLTRVASAAKRGLKRFTMRFSRTPAYAYYLPAGRMDYALLVGDGTSSSTVMAPLLWIARTFPEAPPVVSRRLPDGQLQPVIGHPMVSLLRRPNPYFSGRVLWMATVMDYYVGGNGYWICIRDRQERVTELWWAPAWTMRPMAPLDGSAFITHYEYRPGGGEALNVPVEDVVHFRFGLDPDNPRLGLSPLGSVLREVFTDEEAAAFTASLLRNMGVPGLVVSPDGDFAAEDEDVEETKAFFRTMFSGDRRGEPLIMSAPTRVQQFGFSPEQLNLRELRRIPEERVTAVLGVPAIVAGLGAGLDRSTFTNFSEAREAAYESQIIPSQGVFGEDLRHQLLPNFEPDPEAFEVGFDLSRVRVLQEDRMKQAGRLNTMVAGGWATVGEARREWGGLPVDETHDIFLRPVNLVAVPADGSTPAAGGLEQSAHEALQKRLADLLASTQALHELVGAGANGNGHVPPEGGA